MAQQNILDSTRFALITGCTTQNKKLIDNIIKETEFFNFKKLVGKQIYSGILAELNSEEGYSERLQELLEGGVYQCIAYFSYANYLMQGDVTPTYSGAVSKTNPYSEHISLGKQKNLFTHYSDIAIEHWNEVKDEVNEYFNIGPCSYDGNISAEKFHQIIGVRRGPSKCTVKVSKM